MKKILFVLILAVASSCGIIEEPTDPNYKVDAFEVVDGIYNLEISYRLKDGSSLKFPRFPLRLNKTFKKKGKLSGWDYEVVASPVYHEEEVMIYYMARLKKGEEYFVDNGAVFPR